MQYPRVDGDIKRLRSLKREEIDKIILEAYTALFLAHREEMFLEMGYGRSLRVVANESYWGGFFFLRGTFHTNILGCYFIRTYGRALRYDRYDLLSWKGNEIYDSVTWEKRAFPENPHIFHLILSLPHMGAHGEVRNLLESLSYKLPERREAGNVDATLSLLEEFFRLNDIEVTK